MRTTLDRLQLSAALAAAKTASAGTRLTHRGGGTALPGLAAVAIDPCIVTKITRDLDHGVTIVAGTNGKTTTSRLLAAMLEADGRTVAHNRSGSNLVRGVAAALARQSTLRGHLDADTAVIEADEAAFPELVRMTNPRAIVLTNLFRDQLDRYGELDAIANRWEPVLSALAPEVTVVVNADDPGLTGIVDGSPARTVFYGLDPGRHALAGLPHAADAATCRRCGADLHHDAISVSHLGHWFCPECGWRRPAPDISATDIVLDGIDSLELVLAFPDSAKLGVRLAIPGLYNAYNVLAAAAAATALGVSAQAIAMACTAFTAPFGRVERFAIHGRTITLALVKNPVGFNEMLRMLSGGPLGLDMPALIAINDLDADGRDVSWLWDVDFELLAAGNVPLSTTGIRAADMANRLKYAGVDPARIALRTPELRAGLYAFVDAVPAGGRGFVLATYTAMLELRQVLVDDGLARAYWEE